MSIKNFIPELWTTNLMVALEKSHIFVAVANRNYEGMITKMGDTVHMLQLGDVTIKNYTKNADIDPPEELQDASTLLVIDQGKYFNFAVDDVDKFQANIEFMQEATRRAAYTLRNLVDEYFAGMYEQAGIKLYKAAPVDVNSLNVEDVFIELKEKMNKADVPTENRFAVIPAWLTSSLIRAGLVTKTSNDTLFANGLVDNVMGFSLRESNNVHQTTPTTDQGAHIMAGVIGQSLTFAEQILKTEAYRPERRFADAVKGLHIYGGKVARPDMTATMYINKTSELTES